MDPIIASSLSQLSPQDPLVVNAPCTMYQLPTEILTIILEKAANPFTKQVCRTWHAIQTTIEKKHVDAIHKWEKKHTFLEAFGFYPAPKISPQQFLKELSAFTSTITTHLQNGIKRYFNHSIPQPKTLVEYIVAVAQQKKTPQKTLLKKWQLQKYCTIPTLHRFFSRLTRYHNLVCMQTIPDPKPSLPLSKEETIIQITDWRNKNKSITTISLINQGLLACPSIIYELSHLSTLLLNNNHIRSFPSKDQIPPLTVLSLSKNQLKRAPSIISQLIANKKITFIDLSHNQITEFHQKTTSSHHCRIDLKGNPIKKIDPTTSQTIHLSLDSPFPFSPLVSVIIQPITNIWDKLSSLFTFPSNL